MDGKLKNSILDIAHNNYNYLMNLENVNGVGLGYKWINGINTFEPCIHVLVDKKLSSNYIALNNIIPKTYMGIKTDVIETGKFKFSFSDSNEDGKITGKYRPLEGGCRIIVDIGEFELDGTLGCIVSKIEEGKKEFFILSNNHILADFNQQPLGSPIIQKDISILEEEDDDEIARLADFIPLKFTKADAIDKENKGELNQVDCAIAKIIRKEDISNLIIGIGEIKGVAKAVLGEKIKKVGFETGFTEGTVLTLGATEIIQVSDDDVVVFKDQILCDLPSDEGDSGCVVLNNDNKVIGLLVGNGESDKITLNDINIVLEKLNVKLYTG